MTFKKEIFIRVLPEKYKIDEVYSYTQVFSTKNPSLKFENKSKGKILIVVPFDGFKFFTRQNLKDVLKSTLWPKKMEGDEIQIGQLLFSDYAKTDLGKLLGLGDSYDAIPLKIRVKGEGLPEEKPFKPWDHNIALEYLKHLVTDQYNCEVTHEYKPGALAPLTFDIQVKVSDPDNTTLNDKNTYHDIYEEYLDGNVSFSKVIESLRKEVNFKPDVMISIDTTLNLPKPYADKKPVIGKLGLFWPYMPFFENVLLYPDRVDPEDSTGRKLVRNGEMGRSDPKGESIVWTGIPFFLEKDDPTAVFRAKWMDLFIKHPIDLFPLEKIKGVMEIKIPESLFSGLNIRVFDAWGQMIRDVEAKEKMSQINIDFEIELREFFQKRKRTHCCMFHVDEILLDDADATHIELELKNMGYQIDQKSISRRFNPLIIGIRKAGAGNIKLWINMEISPKSPHRIRDIGGEQVFSSQLSSGSVRLYVRGEATKGGVALTSEINRLQKAIRNRFKKLSYKY